MTPVSPSKPGHFRGYTKGISIVQPRNSYMACIATKLTEVWDAATQRWNPIPDTHDLQADVLIPLTKTTGELNTTGLSQIKDALDWTPEKGQAALTGIGATQIQVQFEEETYNGRTSIKATWLRHYDSVPGQRLRPLTDAKALSQLDALLTGGAAAVASTPAATSAGDVDPLAANGNDDLPF